MSYYMGDYYAGDPGIGTFFKKALGIGAGAAFPGLGPLVTRGAAAIMKAKEVFKPRMTAAAGAVSTAIVKHPVASAAAAAGALGAIGVAGRMTAPGISGHPMKGFHVNKHGKLVRNRRMNPCNPRALRRSVRRLHSFAKHYRHVVAFASPRKPKGKMWFPKKRRRS